jgi:lysophospholipase L1-like esterase
MVPSILMIGDSITEGFDTAHFLPGIRITNHGVSGDSTEECLGRISPTWFTQQPDVVLLCIGTNDMARDRSDEVILNGIRSIVEKVREFSGPVIYLTTVFPTRNNPPRPNERIRTFNAQLELLSAELRCRFFALHGHFTDDAGELKAEYTEDGLHLTTRAYQRWSEVLSALLKEY